MGKEKVMIYVEHIDRLKEAMNPTVLNFLTDGSGSMKKLNKQGIPCETINQVLIPALKGSHPDRRGLLRTSIGIFSDGKIEGLTRGYLSVDQLMRRPIKNTDLYKPGANRATALYASIISAVKSCFGAAQVIKNMRGCTLVKAHAAILTDGANYTNDPTTAKDVAMAVRQANSNGVELKVYMAYFKTEEGLREKDFRAVAKECGVENNNCYFWADHGDTLEEQRKAFRHMVGTLSTRF
jgi:hypothetical protein